MRNECNIVKDLLPLYLDGIASTDTVSYVEEHLETCDACRAELGSLKIPSDLEKAAAEIEGSAMPLKTIKRKWQKKKAILVFSTLFSTIILMVALLFALEYFVYQEKIAVNDAVYTQTGVVVAELPKGSIKLGYLQAISLRTTANPMGNFMATNLERKYGGCSIYQSSADEQIIYLEDNSGFFIPFEWTEPLTQIVNLPGRK